MAGWFAGDGGAPGGTGVDWSNRVETITQLIALGYADGDSLYVGPGVYRETGVLGAGGSTVDNTGTVAVTNESTAVVGVGMNWIAAVPPLPVEAGDQLFIGNFRTAADGACAGGVLTMTSATGNFDADLAGYMVEIIGRGAYMIATAGGITLTLADLNGLGVPAVGAGLTYYIITGEGPYEIESVTDGTNLVLVEPWSGPTIDGLAYEIYRPVYLIADVSGEVTDGVGGVIRLTGANDDTGDPGVIVRPDGFQGSAGDDYWHIRGFRVTNHSAYGYDFDECDMIVIEDTVGVDNEDGFIRGTNPTRHIVRRAISLGGFDAPLLSLTHSSAIENSQCLGENLYAYSGSGVYCDYVAGVTVKNLTMGFDNEYALYVINVHDDDIGNAVFLHDSLIHFCHGTAAVRAGANGMIVENVNNFWQNATDRLNVDNIDGDDTDYLHLPALPLLTGRTRNPMLFFSPSQWEPTRAAAGQYPKNMDLFGVHNEIAQTRRSWGAMHDHSTTRSETQAYGSFIGSLFMPTSMEQQFVFPVKEIWEYVVTVWVYLEPNYTGNPPELVVRQPGMADESDESTGALGVWEQLSVGVTTGDDLDWISVALRSNNTATGVDTGCYWQDLKVN